MIIDFGISDNYIDKNLSKVIYHRQKGLYMSYVMVIYYVNKSVIKISSLIIYLFDPWTEYIYVHDLNSKPQFDFPPWKKNFKKSKI